jgi:hypothetical protein
MKWEYDILKLDGNDIIRDVLCEAGKKEWELVSVVDEPQHGCSYAYLKRPLKEPEMPVIPTIQMTAPATPVEVVIPVAKPDPTPDPRCNNVIRQTKGAVWPRTCAVCGLGPCKFPGESRKVGNENEVAK